MSSLRDEILLFRYFLKRTESDKTFNKSFFSKALVDSSHLVDLNFLRVIILILDLID
jgi:hypothetical protein